MVKPFRDEYEFTAYVIKLARSHGWKVLRVPRTHGSKQGGWHTNTTLPGWPDLLLFRAPQVICLELKMPGNKLSEAQREVIAELQQCSVPLEAWTVYPGDLPTVTDMLTARPHPRLREAHLRLAEMSPAEVAAFMDWTPSPVEG